MTHPRPSLADLLTEVEALTPAALDLTRRAVEVNSYTANIVGVNAVGALLGAAFDWPTLDQTRVAGTLYGDHLSWRTRAAGPRILLVGHHDTVFPPGHFEGWSVQGERATGPGVLDMKGGLAVIWNAVAAFERLGLLEQLPIAIISVADEEVGSPESRPHLCELARGASCGLVFEAGRAGDAIVTRRRGTGVLSVHFEGRAAHAGNAHAAGRNALWAMARFIDAAQRMTDYARGSTVNVGLARGGTSSNTVPAQAECAVDLRFERSADAEALLKALSLAAQDAARSVGATVSVSGGANRMPLDRSPASAALYAEYAACARAAGLGAVEHDLVGGGSDANTVATVGVPAIDGLGPRGEGFHTTSEWVDMTSFRPKAEALARFLWQRLASQERA